MTTWSDLTRREQSILHLLQIAEAEALACHLKPETDADVVVGELTRLLGPLFRPASWMVEWDRLTQQAWGHTRKALQGKGLVDAYTQPVEFLGVEWQPRQRYFLTPEGSDLVAGQTPFKELNGTCGMAGCSRWLPPNIGTGRCVRCDGGRGFRTARPTSFSIASDDYREFARTGWAEAVGAGLLTTEEAAKGMTLGRTILRRTGESLLLIAKEAMAEATAS